MERSSKLVFDTNVLIVANFGVAPDEIDDERLDLDCVEECMLRIERVIYGSGEYAVVIDGDWEILNEYSNKLSKEGRGVGDQFLKWLYNNQFNEAVVNRVSLTKTSEYQYEEFPGNDGLESFDPADRKFVAVAHAHPEKQNILQATDAKWLGWAPALEEEGITVEFLCEDYAKALYEQKMGRK
jgi:hypothetical protein